MHWVGLISRYRHAVAVGIALAGHVVAGAVILSIPRPAFQGAPTVLPVSLVVLPPQPPAPEPEPPEVDTPEPVTPLSSPPTPPRNVATTLPVHSDPDPETGDEVIALVPFTAPAPSNDITSDAAEQAARVQQALLRNRCQQLANLNDPDCPDDQRFAAHAPSPAEQLRAANLGPPPAQNMIEAYMARNSGWPSRMVSVRDGDTLSGQSLIDLGTIDNSIFADPMAPGAYNAQRIRNGDDPIWSRKFIKELQTPAD